MLNGNAPHPTLSPEAKGEGTKSVHPTLSLEAKREGTINAAPHPRLFLEARGEGTILDYGKIRFRKSILIGTRWMLVGDRTTRLFEVGSFAKSNLIAASLSEIKETSLPIDL